MKIIIRLTFEPVVPALQVSSETARWPAQQTLAEEGIHPWSESTPEPLVALVKDCRQSLAHCPVHLKSEKKTLRWNHHLRTVLPWALTATGRDWRVLELRIHWACFKRESESDGIRIRINQNCTIQLSLVYMYMFLPPYHAYNNHVTQTNPGLLKRESDVLLK